jgi:uroporphyrinogen-III synthase
VYLVLTRPAADAERSAEVLRARGHTVIVAPLLRIEPVEHDIAGGLFAGIVVTSANIGPVMAGHPRLAEFRTLPVFSVGKRSAQAMRDTGFVDVTSADGDVDDLARLVAARFKPGQSLLYLAAADRAGDIAGALTVKGIDVCTVVVYRASADAELPAAAVAALAREPSGVLHYSRRSAEAFLMAARQAGLQEPALKTSTHYCLSPRVAEVLAEAGAADIRVAAAPTETALLALIPAAQTPKP